MAQISAISAHSQTKLDGCIVWYAHNTVLGSKHLAVCATVYVSMSKDNKWST